MAAERTGLLNIIQIIEVPVNALDYLIVSIIPDYGIIPALSLVGDFKRHIIAAFHTKSPGFHIRYAPPRPRGYDTVDIKVKADGFHAPVRATDITINLCIGLYILYCA